MRLFPLAIILSFVSGGSIYAQTDGSGAATAGAGTPSVIPLEVPAGTPLPVVLDQEVRIHEAGQAAVREEGGRAGLRL